LVRGASILLIWINLEMGRHNECQDSQKRRRKDYPEVCLLSGERNRPFDLMSKLSVCQVCGGRGEVTMPEPAIECVYCGGTGIHRDQRLTCVVCGGKGMVEIKEPVEQCPRCNGKGIVKGDYLPCLKCGGKGVIAKK